MSSSLPIGPYDPSMPHNRWSMSDRPELSSLEKRAHEIASRAIKPAASEGTQVPADRMTHDKDMRIWLDDVHTLCTDILMGREKGNVLPIDFLSIQREVDKIHHQVANSRLVNENELLRRSDFTQLLHTVESDLQAVQNAFPFMTLYDNLTESLKHWNSLAEHPLYSNGEPLKENAYDSLDQYVKLQTMFIRLQGIAPASPQEEALLKEMRKDFKKIQQSFEDYVLPALQEKLNEGKRNYQSAAKGMKRPGLRNRWKKDSASALIEDFSRFQHALANVRYQKHLIETACNQLPQPTKAITRVLSTLLADAEIAGKSIENVEESFVKRMAALIPQEKERLSLMLDSDLAIRPEAQALLRSINEILSKQASHDEYFKKIEGITQQDQDFSSRELYHQVLAKEYEDDLKASQRNLKKWENELADRLEQGPSVWKQRALGLFFLALHAGSAVRGIQEMHKEAASLPSRADRLQKELISLAGRQVERGAAFIGTMLADKYEDIKLMSEADFQRMTKSFPQGVREALEPFRRGSPKPSSEEIFAIHQQYVLQNANPSLKEQISNWYTQFTSNQLDETFPSESAQAQEDSLMVHEQLASANSLKLGGFLLDALKNGDSRAATQWIDAGADLNVKDENGNTPLHFAVDDPDIAEILIAKGANVNAVNKDGNSPLAYVFKNYMMDVYLKAGINPNLEIHGKPLLQHAIENQRRDIVIELLNYGADPNGKTSDGVPFLYRAIELNFSSAINTFLDYGADIHALNKYGHLPDNLDPDLLMRLFEGGLNPELKTKSGSSLLLVASQAGNLDAFKFLIEKGADVNAVNKDGIPILYQAIEAGNSRAVDVFLDYGADISALNKYGHLPDNLNPNLLIRLLQDGLNPNLKTENGSSLLHIASSHGDLDAVKLLIARGLNIHVVDKKGDSPIFHAHASPEIVSLLLDAGIDPNIKDSDGASLLHQAVLFDNLDTVKILIAKGVDIHVLDKRGNSPIFDASPEMAILFLDAGIDPNIKDSKGVPLLHDAVLNHRASVVAKLITKGVNLDAVDNAGTSLVDMMPDWTEDIAIQLLDAGFFSSHPDLKLDPLFQQAIDLGWLKLTKALMAKGVDINLVDQRGNSPLHRILHQAKSGTFRFLLNKKFERTAIALLNAGTDPNIPDADGNFPLHLAIEAHFLDLAKALLANKANVHALNRQGNSPFHIALSNMEDDFIIALLEAGGADALSLISLIKLSRSEFLPVLLNQGPNLDAADQNGMTALHWAYLLNLPEVAQFLQSRGANADILNRFGMRPEELISREESLKMQLETTSRLRTSRGVPLEVSEKLKDKSLGKGISGGHIAYALPPTLDPASVALDADAADIIAPVAVVKGDYFADVRTGVSRTTGALRQRLGSLTGKYFDDLLKHYAISDIQGFNVPETMIGNAEGSSIPTPVSITRFVSSSLDMAETNIDGISEGEWTKLFVLDVVLGNTDRHMSNFRVQTVVNLKGEKVRKVIPIDHDLILPSREDEYRWSAQSMSFQPLSEEWKAFILGIDADALWQQYEAEAAVFSNTYSDYTQGVTGIDDRSYLGFQMRVKILQEGAKRNWSTKEIGYLFQGYSGQFMIGDNPQATREERKAYIFNNIVDYFTAKDKVV